MCWWPCCGDTYNIRRYSRTGSVRWSATIMGDPARLFSPIIKDDSLYVTAAHIGLQPEEHVLGKFDVSDPDATPDELWTVTAETIAEWMSVSTPLASARIFGVDNNGYAFAIAFRPRMGSFPVIPATTFIFKIDAENGTLVAQRQLTHSVEGIPQPQQIIPIDLAVDDDGKIFMGTQPFRSVRASTFPNIYHWANLVALNDDLTTLWMASTDADPSRMPPRINSIDTDGTNILWGNAGRSQATNGGFLNDFFDAIGVSSASDGSISWSADPGQATVSDADGWGGNVLSATINTFAVDKAIYLKREGLPHGPADGTILLRTRTLSSGATQDVVHPSETSFSEELSPRRTSGAVARIVLSEEATQEEIDEANEEGRGWTNNLAIWEDLQAGILKYTKIVDLPFGNPVLSTNGEPIPVYIDKSGPDDDVISVGALVKD